MESNILLERRALEFRQEHGLGPADAVQLKSLLLKLQVLTVYWPMSDAFSGMSLKDNDSRRFILINSNQPRGRQHFTIAHELYHLFIEDAPKPHNCGEGEKSSSEVNADKFASIFLMPEAAVIQMLPVAELQTKQVSLATVIRLEHYFSVSRIALLNRLTDLKIITKTQRETFLRVPVMESARQFGYDTSLYTKGNEGLVIGNYGELAQSLFQQGEISEGHLIEVMNKLW